MSCRSKSVKAMATAAAIESMMSALTFGLLSSSIEIEESVTGEPAGTVAAVLALGAVATLTCPNMVMTVETVVQGLRRLHAAARLRVRSKRNVRNE